MSDILKNLFIVLITQLPLLSSFWLVWEEVKARPIYAALVGLLYEAVVFALAFGKKVWKEELEKDAIKATADWVRGFVRAFAPGFPRRYKKKVLDEHGGFNVRGLVTMPTYRLSLEQVFVDLRVHPTNPQLLNKNLIGQKNLAGNRPIWEFLRSGKSDNSEARTLAIIGPPGSGKTTLLRHVALTLAANRQHRYRVRAYTPILLSLRNHTTTITQEKPPSLGKLAQDYFSDGNLFATLKPPANWFRQRLENGKCLILFDGLDEVADIQQRRAVSAWVDTQIKNYSRCRFILTARPQGYMDAPLERADVVLEVQPFNSEQVWKFIKNWYHSNEIASSGGKNDASVRQRALTDATDLRLRLRAVPALNALTVNPLLLTMIAMVHCHRGALPGSRVGLYAEICEVLLERWRQVRGISDQLKAAQKLVVLRPLAAYMMERKVRDISTNEAMPIVKPLLERVGITGDAAENFLIDLESNSSLLVEREAGQWSFAHLTFQEYLTAAHWLEQRVTNRNWHELVDDSWWHETLRLYAAQGDATPLVKACLETDNVSSLTLVADFLEESRDLDPRVRRDAGARVIADLESTDPARRRLAAEVKLSRRLKSFQRMDERREIDLEYLTCAEYQLFLDDIQAEGKHHQPDHWLSLSFPKGQANAPVTGVRFEDVSTFFDWLTQKQGGSMRYRFPLPEEARQYLVRGETVGRGTLAAWCADGSLSGLITAQEQEIVRQLKKLSHMPLVFTPTTLVRALLRDVDNPSIRALDLALVRARALALNFDRAHPIDRQVALDLGFVRDFALDLALRVLALALALDRTLGRDVALGRDFALDRALALDIALNLALALAIALDRTLGRDLGRDLASDLARVQAIAPDRALAINRARALCNAIKDLRVAVNHSQFQEPQRIIENWLSEPKFVFVRTATLLKGLLSVINAERPERARQELRRHTAHVLEYAYAALTELDQYHTSPPSRRLLKFLLRDRSFEDLAQNVLSLYWWLQIVIARDEGKLPAWEGIRIVREQVLRIPEIEIPN